MQSRTHASLEQVALLAEVNPVISVLPYTSDPQQKGPSLSSNLIDRYKETNEEAGDPEDIQQLSIPSAVAALAAARLYRASAGGRRIVVSGESYRNGTNTGHGIGAALRLCGVPNKAITVLDDGSATAPQIDRLQNYQQKRHEASQTLLGFGDHLRRRAGILAARAGVHGNMMPIQNALRITNAPTHLSVIARIFESWNTDYETRAVNYTRPFLSIPGFAGFRAAVIASDAATKFGGKNVITAVETGSLTVPYKFKQVRAA